MIISSSDTDVENDSVHNDEIITTTSNLALKNIDITILPGEKVAICGRSGRYAPLSKIQKKALTPPSGKSSLLLLLLSLLSPLPTCSKNITISSLPLHKISRSALRERIIAIPQEPVFLPDGTSFITNLDPFSLSTESEAREVLKIVGLWEMVNERGGLNGGMEAGVLSQGQKQLFSVARAVLRGRIRGRELKSKFPCLEMENEKNKEKGEGEGKKQGGILLLDEISSSVDQETDRLIQGIIKREFESYTVVMVSHRLEMVMGFDRVIVLDRGIIVENGDPRELSQMNGGWFRELWIVGGRGG